MSRVGEVQSPPKLANIYCYDAQPSQSSSQDSIHVRNHGEYSPRGIVVFTKTGNSGSTRSFIKGQFTSQLSLNSFSLSLSPRRAPKYSYGFENHWKTVYDQTCSRSGQGIDRDLSKYDNNNCLRTTSKTEQTI